MKRKKRKKIFTNSWTGLRSFLLKPILSFSKYILTPPSPKISFYFNKMIKVKKKVFPWLYWLYLVIFQRKFFYISLSGEQITLWSPTTSRICPSGLTAGFPVSKLGDILKMNFASRRPVCRIWVALCIIMPNS